MTQIINRQRPTVRLNRGPVLPNFTRVVGANLAPTPAETDPVPDDAWMQMWNTWDWAGEIKPQVDAAHGIGANTIRAICGAQGPLRSVYTRATFQARVAQLVNYCASLGMFTYFSACAYTEINAVHAATYTWTQLQAEIVAFAQYLAGFPDTVIALDVCSEIDLANPDTATNFPNVAGIIAACQAAGPVPITASMLSPSGGKYAGALSIVDFYDWHAWGPSTGISDLSAIYDGRNSPYRPFMASEFGVPISNASTFQGGGWTNTTRQTYAASIKNIAHDDPRCIGSCVYAITDQSAVTDNYGLFDRSFVYRPGSIGDVFQTFTHTR